MAGERFELATLVTAARMPEASVVRALDPAVAARLVTEVPGPGLGYRFIHALVRATLYEVLPGARRAALHRRMGKAIEAVHGARVGDHLPALARHFVRAAADGDVEAGVLYATRAGDRAMAQLAHGEAALYYQQALALWERTDAPPDQPRRLDLLISLGEAQRGAGDVAYRHTLFDAARLAQDRGDGPALARAALATSRGGTASSLGSIDAEVVAVLESAVALLDTADSPLRARLLANLAVELAFAAPG